MANLSNINNKLLVGTNGEVRIGDTATVANVKLRVKQTAQQWTAQFVNTDSSVAYGISIDTSASSYGAAGTLQCYTNSGGGFIVRNDGKVGIGTTSPSKQLMLYGNTPFIRLEDTQGGSKRLDLWVDSNAVAHIDANQSAQQITFRTASTDRLRITNAGNVGIGTILPNHKLDIYSNENVPLRIHRPSNANLDSSGAWGIGFSTRGDAITSTTDTRAGIFSYYNGNLFFATNTSSIVADPDASARMTILNNGNVGIGTTSPLVRLQLERTVSNTTSRTAPVNLIYLTSDHPSVGYGGFGTAITHYSRTYQNSAKTEQSKIAFTQQGDSVSTAGSTIDFYTKTLSTGSAAPEMRMRINYNGNVGIGTSSPDTLLTLETASSPTLKIKDTTQGATLLAFSQNSNSHIGTYSSHPLVFDTNSSERMRITSAGNVGIGSTNPTSISANTSSLTVGSSRNDLTGAIVYQANGTIKSQMYWDSAGLQTVVNSGDARWYTGGVNDRLRITSGGNVGIGTTSPSVRLEVGKNDSEVEVLSVRYSTVPAYISSSFDGSYALSTFSTNQYNTSDGSAGWGSMSNASYGTASVQLAANTQGGELRFFTAPGANQDPTERMRIDSSGRVEVTSRVLSIDAVDEYRENFTTTGNATPSFDIDVKSIGASGQPFEVFVAWTHYSTSYGAGLHQAYYQRSTVQSNITLIHTYFNQTSTLGGAWSVSYVNATTIRVSKSAGTHAGAGYGYIRVTRLKP